jgi:hypothetical protein
MRRLTGSFAGASGALAPGAEGCGARAEISGAGPSAVGGSVGGVVAGTNTGTGAGTGAGARTAGPEGAGDAWDGGVG